MYTILITLALAVSNCWCTLAEQNQQPGVTLTRHRRYLIYPDGDPARVQLIIGMGLPLDLEDEAVTIGYVIKILYHVPQNSTDYTSHFYESAANFRSHRMLRTRSIDEKDIAEHENTLEEPSRKFDTQSAYSEGGKINLMTKNNIDEGYPIIDEKLNKPKTTRWDIYRVLENMIEQNGFSGRACILRTICEAADTPFTYKNGLLGELAHIILTPSTSNDHLSHHTDNEYHAAEHLGADPESDCEYLFPECHQSILELVSEVGFASMFGG